MTKDQFRDKYGDEPRKDDLTILAPKQAGTAAALVCVWERHAGAPVIVVLCRNLDAADGA